ncbi:uncharacterized protein LOC132704477 [Cylas formicarius]|uniref:uncharacterized protein LOC132704477 n=1 Tax=Cylas formicarius TaxID=197179 RepID=UPI002958D853|nr:uncharacterized protein LOC132704477 [Cylas formicarius]
MDLNFCAAHVNVRSLLANFDSFLSQLLSNNYDIVGVSETWLGAGVDQMVGIPNYNFLHHNHLDRRGGGVGVYVKNNLRCEVLASACLEHIEYIWVKVLLNNRTFMVGTVYRPPNTNVSQFFNTLEESLFNIYSDYDNLICFGDFNINMLNLDTDLGTRLTSVFSTFNIDQYEQEPTRIALNSMSLLDLIFTNVKNVSDVRVVDNNIADHFLTYIKFSLDLPDNEPEFKRDLLDLPLNNLLYFCDIEQKLNLLNTCILELFNKHAPLKRFRKNENYNYAPWITENIRLLQKLRNKALKKFKLTKQHITNNVDQINNFFINSVENNDSPNQELLNFYYNNRLNDRTDHYDFVLSTEDEILNILKNITSKATGHDDINISLILLCCPYIAPYITHIINECILNSYFPSTWKRAPVIPIPKINNPSEFSHLRSISILPVLSKVLERIMNDQMVNFLNSNHILPEKQSGFRPNHSCECAMLDITDDIFRATDDGKITVLILLDFNKTFDMINHSILLAILHYVGFPKVLKRFRVPFCQVGHNGLSTISSSHRS